jgi:hypothetical protein
MKDEVKNSRNRRRDRINRKEVKKKEGKARNEGEKDE